MTAPDTGLNFGQLHQQYGQESELLPEGSYDVVVEEAKSQSSKDGSKPQLLVRFKIVDHPKASGRKLTNTFTVTTTSEAAMGMFFRHMAGLGFGGDFFAANPVNPLPTIAAQAVGRRARVSVTHDTYQGVTRPKVKNVFPANAAASGGLPGGLPPAPGGLVPPPPVAQVPPVQQLMQPAAAAPAPAPAVQEQVPAAAPVAAPVQEQAAPAPVAAALAPAPAPAADSTPAPPSVPF